MNMLERFLGHDLDSTRELLALCRQVSDEDMDRPFDIGQGTVRRTLTHMIRNIELWTDLMMARPPRPDSSRVTATGLSARLEQAYGEFAAFARQVEAEGRLDALWTDVLDDPPVEKSYGGAIGHVITHNIGHRAEVLAMLDRLGLADLPEGDLMSWDQRRPAT